MVEDFAMGPYAHALALGTDLTDPEKQQIAEKLHEYTGLPVDYLVKANLRVDGGEFEKTLLGDGDLTVGRAGQNYLAVAYEIGDHWNFMRGGDPLLNVANDLASAVKANPRMKVMVNGGYYDIATPFFAAEYEDKHLAIPQSLIRNIEYSWYEAGHMVYVKDDCLKQLHDRVAAFIKSAE